MTVESLARLHLRLILDTRPALGHTVTLYVSKPTILSDGRTFERGALAPDVPHDEARRLVNSSVAHFDRVARTRAGEAWLRDWRRYEGAIGTSLSLRAEVTDAACVMYLDDET